MKFIVCAALFVLALAAAEASDAGQFIPKAFYTLDAEGKKSDIHSVSPHTAHYLRRLRRDTFVSSSSSSSSSSSNGGPVYFTSQQVVQHGVQPDSIINSRFGESSPSGPVTTGHIVSTTGVIDENGRIRYQTQQGKL